MLLLLFAAPAVVVTGTFQALTYEALDVAAFTSDSSPTAVFSYTYVN